MVNGVDGGEGVEGDRGHIYSVDLHPLKYNVTGTCGLYGNVKVLTSVGHPELNLFFFVKVLYLQDCCIPGGNTELKTTKIKWKRSCSE